MDCFKNLILKSRGKENVEDIISLAKKMNIDLDYDSAAIILVNVKAYEKKSDKELLEIASSHKDLDLNEAKSYPTKETVRYIKNISDDITYDTGMWGYTLSSKVVKREAKFFKEGPAGEGWYDIYYVYGQEYGILRNEILK